MAKQTINIGTSPNKGDGDPIRTAFDKVNDNFTELYSDVKQLNSVNFGGGTFTSDVIGTVFAHDSTMLIDANDGEIVGPLASTSWQTNNAIDIDSTTGDIDITAAGVLTLEHSSQDDYIKIDNSGVEIFSDGTVEIKSQGTDIQIGFDTTSGDVQIGHNSSNLFVNGTLTVNEFSKLVPPDYDTVARNGLAAVDGQMIFNTDTEDLEVYFNGVWKNATTTDVGDLTDNGNVIPTDVSDLTDTTVIIKSDVSQLTDNTNRIPTDIGDLLSGGNTGDVITRTAVGYGWTAPSYFGGAFSDLTSTPTTIAGYGITDAVALTGLSVSTASAGTAALAYNNSTGEFTFTPPDLSSYLTSYTETDPVVGAITGIVKADGAGNISAAVAGTDYLASVAFSDLTSTPTTIAGYGITDAVAISGGNISLADNEKIIFGNDDDLEIFHNASNGNTIIENNTGNLVIKGSNLFLQSASSEYFFRGAANGAVTLYYDNVATFNTSAGGIQIEQGVEEKFATTNAATGVTALDCATGHVHYLTSPAGDVTANFTNLNLTAEYATNLTVIINQGATPYEVTAVQIGGAAQTINWQGGSAPTGNANGIDSFSFTILNDGGTYVVLGQMVDFT